MDKMTDKLVSVIIPCRNEEHFIENCLDSILANDYPKDLLEVLVVDGESRDQTISIVDTYIRKYPFINIINNPKKIIPAAMNLGIRNANGEIIIKMDAHSTYPPDFISLCVYYLLHYDVQNVGGVLDITPWNESRVAKAISLALAHPFASGNAYIKLGSDSPRLSDSVAFGCYKKEIFQKVGYFNENLGGSSDMDFNIRIKRAGGKILLVPQIKVFYRSDPDLRAFWKHNFGDGLWATYALKFGSKAFSWRHMIPFIFVSSLLFLGFLSIISSKFSLLFVALSGVYIFVNLATSVRLAIKNRQFNLLWYFPAVFTTRHFAHGLGACWGVLMIIFQDLTWKGRRAV